MSGAGVITGVSGSIVDEFGLYQSNGSPSAIRLQSGNILVTWAAGSDETMGSAGSAVHAAVLAADGSVLISDFIVSSNTYNTKNSISIDQDASGNVFFAWTSYEQPSSLSPSTNDDVYGRVWSESALSFVGSEFLIAGGSAADRLPTVRSVGDGFAVTWNTGPTLRFGLFDAYGNVDVAPQNTGINHFPSLASNANVIYHNDGTFSIYSLNPNDTFFGATSFPRPQTDTYDLSGVLLSTRSFMSDWAGGRSGLHIAASDDDRFFVTWIEANADRSQSLKGQWLDSSYLPLTQKIDISDVPAGTYRAFASFDLNGAVMVSWNSAVSFSNSTADYDVKGVVIDRDGEFLSDIVTLTQETYGSQYASGLLQVEAGVILSLYVSDVFDRDGRPIANQISLDSFGFSIDRPAVGSIAISGSAVEGSTLTVDQSLLSDPDGLNQSSIEIKWFRSGEIIENATIKSYNLTQADVGAEISVQVSYTDNYGNSSTVTSAATAVVGNLNDAPLGAVTISGTAAQGQTLTADITAIMDVDGIDTSTIAYQWLRGGEAITGADTSSYVLTQTDVGAAISVRMSYTDEFATPETVTSAATAAVGNLNEAPVGASSINLGASPEDVAKTITAAALLAGATDADGDTLSVANLQASTGSLLDNSDGTWTWTPAANDTTGVTFTYNVTDGTASVAQTAWMDLLPVNDKPTIDNSLPEYGINQITNGSFSENTQNWITQTGQLYGMYSLDAAFSINFLELNALGFDVVPGWVAETDQNQAIGNFDIIIGQRFCDPSDPLYLPSTDGFFVDLGGMVDGQALGSPSSPHALLSYKLVDRTTSSSILSFDFSLWDERNAGTSDFAVFVNNEIVAHFVLRDVSEGWLINGIKLGVSYGDVDSTDGTSGWKHASIEIPDSFGAVLSIGFQSGAWNGLGFDPTAQVDDWGAALDNVSLTERVSSPQLLALDLGDFSRIQPRVISAIELLSGANDVDGDRLFVTNLLPSSSGTLVDNGDATWTWTTNANDPTDVIYFSYDVSDGISSVGQWARLTRSQVNTVPTSFEAVDLRSVPEDVAKTITAAALLASATDADGDTLSVANLQASTGSLLDNSDGTWTWTPAANDTTGVTFTYNVTDGTASVAQTATMDLTPVNDAPVSASAINLGTSPEDVAKTITAAELLAGAADVDGDILSVADLGASSGTLVANIDATWTWTPAANDTSGATFTYNISDGTASVAQTATLDLTPVNDVPVVATSINLGTSPEDVAKTISATELLAGATDADGDTLTVANLAASSGSLLDNSDGTWTWTPAANDTTGVTFTYNVTDGAASVAQTATLDLTPVNDAPTVTESLYKLFNVSTGASFLITSGMLPSSGTITLTSTTTTLPDTITLDANGKAVISDANGAPELYNVTNSADQYITTISDQIGNITYPNNYSPRVTGGPGNYAPTDSIDLGTSPEDVAKTISATELLAGATDADGDTLTAANLAASSGSLLDNGDGTWTWTPASDDATGVTFTYSITDGIASVVQTATLDLLLVNDAPIVATSIDLGTSPEDVAKTISATELLAGATDADGDTLTVANLAASSGSLLDNSDGTWTWTPAANDTTGVTFTYNVTDGAASVAQTATLDLAPVNDALVVASSINLGTSPEDLVKTITAAALLSGATDADGDILSVIDLVASSGTLVANNNSSWTWTPAANDTTGETFTYRVTDGTASVAQTATLELTPVNDAPTGAVMITGTARQGQTLTASTATIADTDGLGTFGYLWHRNGSPINGAIAASYVLEAGDVGAAISARVSYIDGFGTVETILSAATAVVTSTSVPGVSRTGTSRADIVIGTGGDDVLSGLAGNDLLTGLGGNDRLLGGDGNDTLTGGLGDDYLDGGAGTDTVTYSGQAESVTVSLALTTAQATGTAGSDQMINVENLIGGNGSDTLTGNAGANNINGGSGDDSITGGLGDDTLIGGTNGAAGDTVNYADAMARVTVNLATTSAQVTGGAGRDTISGFENLVGSGFNDVLTGSSGNNVIRGGAGADRIIGGDGTDYLYGDAGPDTFVFTANSNSRVGIARDVIFDLDVGDVLDFSAIDANGPARGNTAFINVGQTAFTGIGQLRMYEAEGTWLVEGNTGGSLDADFQVELRNWSGQPLTELVL